MPQQFALADVKFDAGTPITREAKCRRHSLDS